MPSVSLTYDMKSGGGASSAQWPQGYSWSPGDQIRVKARVGSQDRILDGRYLGSRKDRSAILVCLGEDDISIQVVPTSHLRQQSEPKPPGTISLAPEADWKAASAKFARGEVDLGDSNLSSSEWATAQEGGA